MSDTRVISRNPIDLLMEDHDLLSSLLSAYEDLSPTQSREKISLIRRIQDEIGRHIGTEEALFYPTLLELNDPKIRDYVDEAMAEHRKLESRVDELRRDGPGGQMDLVVDVLKSLADRHLAYEEKEVFPLASKLPRAALNQLGLEIEERRMRENRL
jgi:hemerythrin-like domain-containing protein